MDAVPPTPSTPQLLTKTSKCTPPPPCPKLPAPPASRTISRPLALGLPVELGHPPHPRRRKNQVHHLPQCKVRVHGRVAAQPSHVLGEARRGAADAAAAAAAEASDRRRGAPHGHYAHRGREGDGWAGGGGGGGRTEGDRDRIRLPERERKASTGDGGGASGRVQRGGRTQARQNRGVAIRVTGQQAGRAIVGTEREVPNGQHHGRPDKSVAWRSASEQAATASSERKHPFRQHPKQPGRANIQRMSTSTT